jgi:hypothetical protein
VYETGDVSGPPAGEGPKLKNQSRDTDPNGTVRAATKTPAPVASQSSPTEVEPTFDFEMPLTPVDEDARITDRPPEKKAAAAPPESRPRTDEPTVPVPGSPPAKPAAGGPAKAPAAEKAPAASAATPDAKGMDFSKWEHEEEEVKPEGEEDGDFGDFLKSLGPK